MNVIKFLKKINNNVAWVLNDDDEKVIALAPGISFDKTRGQVLRADQVKRIFTVEEETQEANTFIDSLNTIPEDVLDLTERVSEEAIHMLGIESLQNTHYLSLADHLNYALQRKNQTIDYPEDFQWEVKKTYPKEFQAAIHVIDCIKQETGIELPKSEQTFLTYHFVNAQYDKPNSLNHTLLSDLLQKSIEVIQYQYQMMLDPEAVHYIRFITHLRYFILRQIYNDHSSETVVNEELFELVRNNYERAFQAAIKIGRIITAMTNQIVNEEELFYLTLHIQRVTKSEN